MELPPKIDITSVECGFDDRPLEGRFIPIKDVLLAKDVTPLQGRARHLIAAQGWQFSFPVIRKGSEGEIFKLPAF
jgi:hypothetical protein